MKQAILITAYKNFEQLKELINEFDENFNIYIHVDKKSRLTKKAIREITNISNVKYFTQKYKVNWGGLNHLKAYLKLSEKALLHNENVYFHLITGQDYPLKSNEYIKNMLFNNQDKKLNYMGFFKMPAKCWRNGGMDRLEYYNLYDLFNAKSSFESKWIGRTRRIQKGLGFKRSVNFCKQLYGGSTYWTIHRDTLQFVIHFTKQNPSFLKRFKFTFCAEEIYFQTIIMNSEHADKVVNDDLRYVDWETGRGGYPAFLDENDYESIIKSNKLFVRKIDPDKNKLKQMLTMYRK
ncbi:beta-1,6-N-acetylglucosaminyltransferase [Ancylomarina sp. YFZ004]